MQASFEAGELRDIRDKCMLEELADFVVDHRAWRSPPFECIGRMPLAIRVARVAGSFAATVSHRSFEFNLASVDTSQSCPESRVPTQFQSTLQAQAVPPRHVFKRLVCQALARSAPVDPNSKTPWLDQVSNAEENHRP